MIGCPCSPMASVSALLLAALGRSCSTSPWRAVMRLYVAEHDQIHQFFPIAAQHFVFCRAWAPQQRRTDAAFGQRDLAFAFYRYPQHARQLVANVAVGPGDAAVAGERSDADKSGFQRFAGGVDRNGFQLDAQLGKVPALVCCRPWRRDTAPAACLPNLYRVSDPWGSATARERPVRQSWRRPAPERARTAAVHFPAGAAKGIKRHKSSLSNLVEKRTAIMHGER